MRSLAALLWLATCASAHAASFDGTWSVLQVCETTSEGARGFTWRYDAAVKDGRFVGQYRTKGQSPSMTLAARFEGGKGSGDRLSSRVCKFTFSRQ